ncbi:MAG: hypothetical protein PHD04_01195 [Candidatus Pacebacteria bacterium]|nr:hypothetical protein [Candidatus Paceibacterota bacterium]
MSFFADLFSGKKEEKSVVLIEIGTSSVAGAYARYAENGLPAILYTRRLPIEMHSGESQEKAMLRALQVLGDTLIREGAPLLCQVAGSGSADAIIVAIDSPWQATLVRTEQFEDEQPFIFTRSLVEAKLKESAVATEGKVLVDESIIGTILNGYETRNPYGKEARRATIVVLTSFIDKHAAESITSVLRGIFHTKHIEPIAGPSLRYQALQKAFPHERDALILDATGPYTSIALMHKSFVVSISEIQVSGADTTESWLERIEANLAELARHYPLPRTIFVLAREEEAASLRDILDTAHMGKLWLSDNPPRIVSVLASHLSGLVRQTAPTSPDLLLLLMALYVQYASLEKEL